MMYSLVRRITVCTLSFVVTCPGCGSPDQASANAKRVWFTHCEGPEFRDVTKSPNYGAATPGVIVKITNQLIFAPPPSVFPHYLGDDPKSLKCRHIDDLPQVTTASFQIRASTLTGPESPTVVGAFDPDLVKIYVMGKVQVKARDPSVVEREQEDDYNRSKSKGYPVEKVDQFGLRCHGFPRISMICIGSTAGAPTVVLSTQPGLSQGLRATYYSQKYGGIEIDWLTSLDNLPRWSDVARQIFTDLDNWNALQQGSVHQQ